MTYNLLGKFLNIDTLKVTLLLLYKVGCTVKSNTTIVADDTATSVCVWQTCNDMGMTCSLYVIVISREYTLVVGLAILSKDSLCSRVKLVAIRLQSLLYHTYTTLREYATLQWLIGLQTYNNLTILVYISSSISIDALRHLSLGIIYTLLALHLKHLR